MAFHFRKLKNTLRLLPSTKTMGFSTRLNEGDGHTLSVYPDDYTIASQPGINDLISRSLRQAVNSDLCSADGEGKEGLARSQSNPELTVSSHFVPALIPKPSSVLPLPLPITCNDLTQILRLPVPLGACKDLAACDLASVLRVVYPTSDDILVELTQGISDFIPANTTLKDFFKHSLTSPDSDNAVDRACPNLGRGSSAVNETWISHTPMKTSLMNFSVPCGDHLQTFPSSTDPAVNDDCSSCNLFSSSSSHNADLATSNNRSHQGKGSGKDGPSPEQMHKIKEKLEKTVCKLFSGRQDYSILHKNIVLENNLFGDNKTSVGLLAYGMEILKLRLRIHACFSNTSVQLQSVTMLEQNGVIRIHWRLRGVSQLQTLKFWRIFQNKKTISNDDYEWLEAFSYFHIGKDGLVHKHRIDRMIPDDTSGTDKITNTLRELLTPAKPLVS